VDAFAYVFHWIDDDLERWHFWCGRYIAESV
jgi:hypothetical protein